MVEMTQVKIEHQRNFDTNVTQSKKQALSITAEINPLGKQKLCLVNVNEFFERAICSQILQEN